MSARRVSGAPSLRVGLALAVPALLIGWLVFHDGGYELIVRQQAALTVWWVLALGVAFALVPRARAPRSALLAAGGFAALGALQFASVTWGPSDDRAIADACRTVGYLGILALAWTGLGPRTWTSAAAGIFALASLVVVVALFGRLAPDLTGVQDPFGAGRLGEPLGYWNSLAAWAAATLAMALAWSADGRRRRTRIAAAAVLPIAGSVIYLTYSRGGVLAAALGLALTVGLTRNRNRAAIHAAAAGIATAFCVFAIRSQPQIADGTGTDGALMIGICVVIASGGSALVARATAGVRRSDESKRDAPVLALAATLAAGLVAVALVAGSDGFGRGGDAAVFSEDDPSARLATAAGNRSAYWSEALDAFTDHPVRGEGAGAFGYRWAAEGSEPELVSDAHSLPFAVAAELGLLGVLALGALVVGLALGAAVGLRAAGRNAPAVALAACAGVFALSTAVDWTWDSAALASLGLASAGSLCMAAAVPIRRSRASWRMRWALIAAAVVLGATQVPGIVAADSLREAAEERAQGQFAAAADSAGRALDAAPWSGGAHAARARAELRLGDLDAARGDARAAIDDEPREAKHWILLAEVDAARGDLYGAARALRQAVRLSPHEAQLGRAAVQALGARLERRGFDEADITGDPAPR